MLNAFCKSVGSCLIALVLVAGCVTTEQAAEQGQIGQLMRGGSNGFPPVYRGDVTRKYTVIKEVYRKERQIPGPTYYDVLDGLAWVATLGKEVGADAVINFESKRLPGSIPLLDPGFFEARGVAIKFKN